MPTVFGAAACEGAHADGHCLPHERALLQAKSVNAHGKAREDPSWWAPPEAVAKDDHRYRAFVSKLLKEPVGCEGNSSYEINAKAVDRQHLKVFALANHLRKVLRRRIKEKGLDDGLKLTGDEFKPLDTLLTWLRQYTVVHFDAEEKTLQEVGYLDLMAHKAFHRAFYGHIMMWSEIVDVMMKAKGSFHVGNIYVMLTKWLQDHVCVRDKVAGEFIEKSRLKTAINDNDSPDGVEDTIPDCVPALEGGEDCVSEGLSMLQGERPLKPAPKWWASPELLAAHDYWYRTFVTSLLENSVVCEFSKPVDIAVRAVDAQHHKIQSLVDEVRVLLLKRVKRMGLNDGLKLTGTELEPLSEVLTWLKQYGVVHFDAEEKVMMTLGYPEAKRHKALHRAFYGQMMMASEVARNMVSFGGGFHVGPIYVYMAKWVQDHICTLDKSVGKFIGSKGVELNETEDIIPDGLPLLADRL